jgi:ParB family chromosome partitioning protein
MSYIENKVPLDEIQVGDRCRRDLGNLDELATSIREVGLLHPVVITPDKKLIAGGRRLEAVRKLGWTEVPVRVVTGFEDAALALQAERDENRCRKGFTPSEAAALGRKLEEMERARAKGRQALAGPSEGPGKKETGSGKLPESAQGDTRDKVALSLGMSGRTYEKAKAVVEAAEREPEKYGHLVEQMDRTGKVDGAYRQLREQAGTGRRNKEDDKVTEEVGELGVELPSDLQGVRGEQALEFASVLSYVAQQMDGWARALASAAEEDEPATA